MREKPSGVTKFGWGEIGRSGKSSNASPPSGSLTNALLMKWQVLRAAQVPPATAPCPAAFPSTDLDHDPSADLAVENGAAGLDDLVEADRRRHRGQLLRIEVAGEAAPSLKPQRLWSHDRIDPEERHAAQDER